MPVKLRVTRLRYAQIHGFFQSNAHSRWAITHGPDAKPHPPRPREPAREGHHDPASKITTAKPVVEGDHGRIETRTATVSTDIKWLQHDHRWPGLTAIGKVDRIRKTTTKTTTEIAYYLLSSVLSPERCNEVVRSHWGVENRLHWRLDVTMNEDQNRTRLDNGPHNLAVLRHMALNVMQKDITKGSLRGKFMRAGWDDRYLARLLALF